MQELEFSGFIYCYSSLKEAIKCCFSGVILAFTASSSHSYCLLGGNKKKLRGFSPQANYTDRATAACRRS
jgi:hypothetical protein